MGARWRHAAPFILLEGLRRLKINTFTDNPGIFLSNLIYVDMCMMIRRGTELHGYK